MKKFESKYPITFSFLQIDEKGIPYFETNITKDCFLTLIKSYNYKKRVITRKCHFMINDRNKKVIDYCVIRRD